MHGLQVTYLLFQLPQVCGGQCLDLGAGARTVLPQSKQMADLLHAEAQPARALNKTQRVQVALAVLAIAAFAARRCRQQSDFLVMPNHPRAEPAGLGGLADIHASSGFQRFSSSALLTTQTLLAAIIAPAIIGFSRPTAASGMPRQL